MLPPESRGTRVHAVSERPRAASTSAHPSAPSPVLIPGSFFKDRVLHIPAGYKPRKTLNSFCLCRSSAGLTGVCQHRSGPGSTEGDPGPSACQTNLFYQPSHVPSTHTPPCLLLFQPQGLSLSLHSCLNSEFMASKIPAPSPRGYGQVSSVKGNQAICPQISPRQ